MTSRPGDRGSLGQPDTESSAAGVEASLEEVLDRYLAERTAGDEPDREAYLRAHPSLAEGLRGVFRTLDFVETTSRTLHAATLEPGQMLGEFRIVRVVGRGGMGVVYEAVQVPLQRRVALKVLPPGAMLSETASERFSREAATAGRPGMLCGRCWRMGLRRERLIRLRRGCSVIWMPKCCSTRRGITPGCGVSTRWRSRCVNLGKAGGVRGLRLSICVWRRA